MRYRPQSAFEWGIVGIVVLVAVYVMLTGVSGWLTVRDLHLGAAHFRGAGLLISGLIAGAAALVGGGCIIFLLRRQQAADRARSENDQLDLLHRTLAVLAHEIRNPLASAKGNSQLLAAMLEEDPRVQKKAELIVSELVRLEELTAKMLEFTRSERIDARMVNPEELARRAARRLQADAAIEVDADGTPEQWSLDPNAVEQVLLNVLRNAAQAQAERSDAGAIGLRVQQRGDRLCFEVRDHGPGLPEDIDVLAPFVTSRASGTGLGLAICHQIVKAHGGTLTIANHPDGGTLLQICLPQTSPRAESELRRSSLSGR